MYGILGRLVSKPGAAEIGRESGCAELVAKSLGGAVGYAGVRCA